MKSLDNEQKMNLTQSMMAFVYAHRHNKDDVFILESRKDNYIDFSIVRDVMYSYSKKAQDKFFSHPIESYFLAKFANSPEGQAFICSKETSIHKEANEKIKKLLKDTEELKNIALESLEKAGKIEGPEQAMIKVFLSDLQ